MVIPIEVTPKSSSISLATHVCFAYFGAHSTNEKRPKHHHLGFLFTQLCEIYTYFSGLNTCPGSINLAVRSWREIMCFKLTSLYVYPTAVPSGHSLAEYDTVSKDQTRNFHGPNKTWCFAWGSSGIIMWHITKNKGTTKENTIKWKHY